MTQYIEQIFNLVSNLLGFSPILMIPVFVGVSLIARVFQVKTKLDKFKDFVLGVLCLVVGTGVAYFTGYENLKMMFRNGLILGSVCALTYQIFVSLFETLVSYVDEKIDKVAGKSIDVDKNDLFTGGKDNDS